MKSFSDYFAPVANQYAQHRPHYPDALFDYLATLAKPDAVVWDCAAGSGQATMGLAERFARVIATDASFAQLVQAPRHPRVQYWAARAELSGLSDASVNLVTIAQALHWFDFDRFYQEVRRVTQPGGIIAAVGYGPLRIDDTQIDAAVQQFYRDVVGPYWPSERRWIEENYRTIPFPFEELHAPKLEMHFDWSLDTLIGYIASWSATARYVKARSENPLVALRERLLPWWYGMRTRRISWPLALRIGRIE